MVKNTLGESEWRCGYNREEIYFHGINRTLIDRLRKRSDAGSEKCSKCGNLIDSSEATIPAQNCCVKCEHAHKCNGDINFYLG